MENKKRKELTPEQKEARKLYQKEYKEKNRDIIKESAKKYYEKNKENLQKTNKEYSKIYNKQYYIKNKETINKKSKEYQDNNKDNILSEKKEYYLANKETILSNRKKYYQENKDHINKRKKLYQLANKEKIAKQKKLAQQKFTSTIIGKLTHRIRCNIRQTLVNAGYTKKESTEKILGCTLEAFKLYLESKFEPWMTWDNRGLYNGELNYGWDIDHKIPLCSAKTEEDILKLNHYTNLQPLCSKINRDIKKGNY